MPWLKLLVAGLSLRRPGFVLGSVHVEFVVDRVALEQVLLRGFRFTPCQYHFTIAPHLPFTAPWGVR
jgi:hypothetical protein